MESDSNLFINLFVIAFLLFSNGFFVASEFALVSVRNTRISQLSKEGNFDARLALGALEHLDEYIAATQLGITISSIGLGWVGEATLARMFEPLFGFIPGIGKLVAVHSLAVGAAFTLITMLHVIIGELMPKSIALQFSEKTALIIAKPMYIIAKIFSPFVFILNGIGNALLKLAKVPPATSASLAHTTEELNMIINNSYKEGVLNETEKEMLENIFKFSDLTARQVMIPRPDMTGISANITMDELNGIILEHQYTRYPVYDEDLDHVVGIIHIKDVYKVVSDKSEFNLSKIIRKPMLVPETLTIDALIREFKIKHSQMAIVIDEFGGTAGLVTLEDVLEEVIGEVQDEFDAEEADIKQLNENEFIVNAILRIDEFNEYFETELNDEDIETIGGLVVKKLGKIANVLDETVINNLKFIVQDIDGARIIKLKVIRTQAEEITDLQ